MRIPRHSFHAYNVYHCLKAFNRLQVNFEENPRVRYLELLGYNSDEVGHQVNAALGEVKQKVTQQASDKSESSDSSLRANDSVASLEAFVCHRSVFLHSSLFFFMERFLHGTFTRFL